MASEPPRRTWLRFAGRIIGRLHPGGAEAGAWRQAGRVRARVNPPTFPHRTFEILEYAAVQGGTSMCTDAIREAIRACNAAGVQAPDDASSEAQPGPSGWLGCHVQLISRNVCPGAGCRGCPAFR